MGKDEHNRLKVGLLASAHGFEGSCCCGGGCRQLLQVGCACLSWQLTPSKRRRRQWAAYTGGGRGVSGFAVDFQCGKDKAAKKVSAIYNLLKGVVCNRKNIMGVVLLLVLCVFALRLNRLRRKCQRSQGWSDKSDTRFSFFAPFAKMNQNFFHHQTKLKPTRARPTFSNVY